MKQSKKAKACAVAAVALALGVGATVVIAAPLTASPDNVILGELDHYHPDNEQSIQEGTSLSFDEESDLQQAKTAGFSGGAVVSNLEELPAGITGYSEREPVGTYATTGAPSVIGHGEENGADCLSCHEAADGMKPVPQSHISNNLTNDQCLSCHAYPVEEEK